MKTLSKTKKIILFSIIVVVGTVMCFCILRSNQIFPTKQNSVSPCESIENCLKITRKDWYTDPGGRNSNEIKWEIFINLDTQKSTPISLENSQYIEYRYDDIIKDAKLVISSFNEQEAVIIAEGVGTSIMDCSQKQYVVEKNRGLILDSCTMDAGARIIITFN